MDQYNSVWPLAIPTLLLTTWRASRCHTARLLAKMFDVAMRYMGTINGNNKTFLQRLRCILWVITLHSTISYYKMRFYTRKTELEASTCQFPRKLLSFDIATDHVVSTRQIRQSACQTSVQTNANCLCCSEKWRRTKFTI